MALTDVDQHWADVRLSNELFLDILPRVEDLAELKAVLYVGYLSAHGGGPTVSLRLLLSADVLRSIVGLNSPEPAEERLGRALDRAVANRTLLRITVDDEQLFLPATQENRERINRLHDGILSAANELGVTPGATVTIHRPNVFSLYEQHVGPLTPLTAERLRDAERSYPRSWVEEAILTAVHYNKRNWRYIEAILTRWESAGGPDEAYGRRT